MEDLLADVESVFLTPDPTMPDVLRRNRDASMIPGMLGEFFVRFNGQQQYLWRAVDQDGNVIDILLRSRRDQRAAQRFLHRLLRGQGKQPFRITTDKQELCCCSSNDPAWVIHDTQQYANNRAEISQQPTRMR
jgi:putative transposase